MHILLHFKKCINSLCL